MSQFHSDPNWSWPRRVELRGAHSAPLFDAAESERRKQEGMALAANNPERSDLLELARDRARCIVRERGEVTMDDVVQRLVQDGYDVSGLGNAAGSVFRGKEWEFAGKFVKSARVANHSRLLRVWREAK
jgi:hypothetical protein